MVAIQKAKHGRRLRRPNKRYYDPEKVGLLAAGICVGIFCVVLLNFMKNSSQIEQTQTLHKSIRQQAPVHLESPDHQPLGDKYNAIAVDILQTLNCETLMNTTLSSIQRHHLNPNDDGGGLDDDVFLQNNENQRRRLTGDLQHGDDGGFDNLPANQENQNNNNQATPADDDDGGFQQEGYKPQDGAGGEGGDPAWSEEMMDDEYPENGVWYDDDAQEFDARHLFCMAASQSSPQTVKDNIKCDASNSKRQAILDLWSAARSLMEVNLLQKVLELAHEQPLQEILGFSYSSLWAPNRDIGFEYTVNSLNNDNVPDGPGILNQLSENLGQPQSLFVDIGSGLGLTTLSIKNLYPSTKIVSVEPAPPNWLLQQLNLKCNLEPKQSKSIHSLLAGVGPNSADEDNLMAKLTWRPTSTTSTRSWTPKSEHQDDDMELYVRLRRLRSILGEAEVLGDDIDVLNLDCEGCEYNVVPALTDKEFDKLPTIMGVVHWGYIPLNKKPSSERGRHTHERLCQHEVFAKDAKECCAFAELPVKSRTPGEVLVQEEPDNSNPAFPPKAVTVADLAGSLCENFDEWAKENHLDDVENDWGWFELTAEA